MDLKCKLSCKSQYQKIFASWAKPEKSDINIPRKRFLGSNQEVLWKIGEETGECSDHIEMSGFYASVIISYGRDKSGRLRLMRHLVVPTLRIEPNVTQSSFSCNFYSSQLNIKINGTKAVEYPEVITIKGTLKIESKCADSVTITRELLPAVDRPAVIEVIKIKNQGNTSARIEINSKVFEKKLNRALCVGNTEIKSVSAAVCSDMFYAAAGFNSNVFLKKGESKQVYCLYYAVQDTEIKPFSISEEICKRRNFINEMFTSLKLKTPFKELDAQFAHCILRGSESIFKTKNGLMHAPGGGNYYAALWTNDQCEYANPFFPFSGYKPGIEQSINCYSLYEAYMDKSNRPIREKRALVSSIISQGIDYWNGAGDRGDGEMYAYGVSRFLLEMSDERLIERFWDSLVWCLDFALSRKNDEGVITSDSDELENRFESGNANLFTSCLTYDALGNACILADAVNDEEHKMLWEEERQALRNAIEKYFGCCIEGFETYRYYKENKSLRSWICMPLTVGIFNRAEDTVNALFSDKLYYNGMLRTSSDDDTTWDRSLLFALRGAFLAGFSQKALEETLNYCKNRLLGSHCPYPFEAYPEGNRAHLAAESLLFARAVTEGLFGLCAVGLNKLRIMPQLSKACPKISLSGIKLFSKCFDITADDTGITVKYDNSIYHTVSKAAVFDFNSLCFE